MKIITKIEPQKKRKGRFNVFIDHQFAFGIDEEVLLKQQLYQGMEVSDEKEWLVLQEEEKKRAINYTLKLLSFRMRSKQELRTRLKQKEYNDSLIEEVIKKMTSYGYVDDYEFASQWIQDRQQGKKQGDLRIRQELKLKGVSDDIIKQALSDHYQADDEWNRITELATKKWNSLSKMPPIEKEQKITSFLMRKGYSYSLIKRTIARLKEEGVNDH